MERSRKESILAAAARAFGRRGFKDVSVDEIARSAGVAKGTVYLACASKEDLYYQALHREVRAWVAELARLIDPRVDADDLMRSIAVAGAAALRRRPLLRDLLLRRCHAVLPGWADRLDELYVLGRGHTVEVLQLGVRQGRFRDDLEIERAAELLQDLEVAALLLYGDALPLPADGPRASRARKAPARGDDPLAARLCAGLALVLDGVRRRSVERPAVRQTARPATTQRLARSSTG